MGFANAYLLWALPLGLIPIVIYYLLRFRALRVTWGANYVLQLALERMRKRLHLDQIILMALRVLACLLIVLAFARPVLKRSNPDVTGSGVHHVLVIDGSYSMTAGANGSGGRSRWDLALEAAKKLAATWGRGETWSVCLLADQPRWVVDAQTVQTPGDPIAKLDALRPGESAASLAAAFTQIAAKFPRGRAEFFIFADDQANTWDQADRLSLPAELNATTYWLKPGPPAGPNLAVTALQPAADRLLAAQPSRVVARVRNFSAARVEDLPVELLIDGAFAARQTVSLLPDQESPVFFDIKLADPGPHHLCAQIPEDALAYDNRLYAGIEVVPSLRVLALRDPQKTGKFDSVWGFLETLNRSRQIGASAGTESTPSRLGQIEWVLSEGPLDAAALANADAVILDGGRKLTPELAGTLRDYVAAGGGLILAADASVDPDDVNHLLAEPGLLPARLGRLRSEALGGDQFRSLARSPIGLSPLRLFETELAGDLTQARIYSWFELDPRPGAQSPLVRFDDQSPWALRADGPAGRGRTLLLATGLTGQGNNLIVREFFIPLLHQLVEEAAAARIYPRTLARGQALRLWLDDPAKVQGVTFARQGEEAQAIAPRSASGGAGAGAVAEVNDAALESGLYTTLALREGGSKRSWFGVQGPRVDSDLTPAPALLLAAAASRLNLTTVSDWPALEQALLRQRAGREWYSFAALAAFAFLVGEMLFQRRFAPERSRKAASSAKPARRAVRKADSTPDSGTPASPGAPARS
ncbi:MAG: BatA domain-containing protein [Planctomycetota bacterium]|nr:BatA domain-containing protein [Planctomycetota bacterium]